MKARTDQMSQNAGSEEEPDVPDYGCLSSLPVHTFMLDGE